MIKRLRAIILKEVRHILRDPRTLIIVFVMPVMMVFLFGYALNMDVRRISIGIIDKDHTPESRELVRAFSASKYFRAFDFSQNPPAIETIFADRGIGSVLVVPRGFGNERKTGSGGDIQLIVDGSDPSYGLSAVNYSSAIVQSYSIRGILAPRIEMRENYLYNPELKGVDFIIPGIVALILMMVCALLTSLTVAKEKETGTMDILLVSPVRPFEIIIGKVLPYVLLAFMEAILILGFSWIVFRIPFRGNLLLLFALTALYIYASLGIGLFISTIAGSQQVAMMAAMVATIMPSVLLSGFIFSIFSMPSFIRPITLFVPARHYIVILRGILLKASSFEMLIPEMFFIAGLGTLFTILAIARFRKGVGK